MQSKRLAKNKIEQSTQVYLDISEIKNDAVILKDGSLRAVIMASSINFALKSEDEQKALVGSYVSFLNYLNFPVQIVVQSRQLDISKYLKNLDEAERDLTNDLLKKQLSNYKSYISEMIELGNIMTKRFFIVIPYSPIEDKKRSFFARLGSVFTPAQVIKLNQTKFEKYLGELNQRVNHVSMNITSMGITTVQLDTQGLIELYYNVYNPTVSAKQRLTDIDKLRTESSAM
jgi:hypothetical protein